MNHDILYHIMCYLSIQDIIRCSSVNNLFHTVTSKQNLWKNKLNHDFRCNNTIISEQNHHKEIYKTYYSIHRLYKTNLYNPSHSQKINTFPPKLPFDCKYNTIRHDCTLFTNDPILKMYYRYNFNHTKNFCGYRNIRLSLLTRQKIFCKLTEIISSASLLIDGIIYSMLTTNTINIMYNFYDIVQKIPYRENNIWYHEIIIPFGPTINWIPSVSTQNTTIEIVFYREQLRKYELVNSYILVDHINDFGKSDTALEIFLISPCHYLYIEILDMELDMEMQMLINETYKEKVYNNCSIVYKPKLGVVIIGFFLYLIKQVTSKEILVQFKFDNIVFSIHDKQIKLEFSMAFKLNQCIYYVPLVSFTEYECNLGYNKLYERGAFGISINNIYWEDDDIENIFMYCSPLVLLSSDN